MYKSEAIRLNGDRFVLLDFLVITPKVAFEIYGESHRDLVEHDCRRDQWLLESWGIHTVRITNAQVLKESEAARMVVVEALL